MTKGYRLRIQGGQYMGSKYVPIKGNIKAASGSSAFRALAKAVAPSCDFSLEATSLHPGFWVFFFLNKGQLVWNLSEVDDKSGNTVF